MPNSRLTNIVDFKNFVVSLHNMVKFLKFWFDFENDNFFRISKIFWQPSVSRFRKFSKHAKFSKLSKIEWEFHGGSKFRESDLRSVSYQSLFINLSNHTAKVASFISSISEKKKVRKKFKFLFLKSDNSKVKSSKLKWNALKYFGVIFMVPENVILKYWNILIAIH